MEGDRPVTEGDDGSSFVRKWQLAEMLKGFRESAALTQAQAVEQLRRTGSGKWSGPKLSRVENHEQSVRVSEVAQLLEVYGVEEKEHADVLRLAELARQRDWRAAYGPDVSEVFRGMVSVEAGATAIRQFHTTLVPGLLQTVDYARAIITACTWRTGSAAELERGVARRMTRQHILHRADPPHLHVILDESVLLRVVGGRTVMRDQMRRLVDLFASENVTLQVLSLESGGGPGVDGPFRLISLPRPTPDVLYGEGPHSVNLPVTDSDDVRACTLRFGMLSQLALSSTESAERIEEAARSFEKR